jgi:hypothetical protein
VGSVVEIQAFELAERLGKAFAGFWIGFLTTIILAVASFGLLFDLIFNNGAPNTLPPTAGLALSVIAIVIGRYSSIVFEKLDLRTFLRWTAPEGLARQRPMPLRVPIPAGLNKPVH